MPYTQDRILIVDDDPSFLQSMALALNDLSEVVCVDDHAFDPKMLEAAKVIITDFRMPVNDGHEILRSVKRLGSLAPVILVTAFATKDVAIGAANLHAFAILEKPVDYHAIRDVVIHALEEFKRRKACLANSPGAKPEIPEGGFLLNSVNRTVSFGDSSVGLTEIEFQLFSLFIENQGTCLARDVIVAKVWRNTQVAENLFDTHLGNLKKMLPFLKSRLKVVRGRGYFFE